MNINGVNIMSKTIYYNGNIICADKNNRVKKAVLIKNGKIKAVGSNRKILKAREHARLINLEGKTMLPGFIDSHSYIVAAAQYFTMVNLSEAKSVYDVVKMLLNRFEKRPLKDGEWLFGTEYDNTKFRSGLHPTKFDLDKISKDIPVFIFHVSGRIAVANSKALDLLGYSGKNFTVPSGGVVQMIDGTQEPNGVLEEKAFLSKEKKKLIPSPSVDSVLEALVKAQKLYASYGVTTCQDAGVDEKVNELLQMLSENDMAFIDIIGYAIYPFTEKLMGETNSYSAKYYNHYKLMGGKIWLDGSIVDRTAWLKKPYYKVPKQYVKDYSGYSRITDPVLIDYLAKCILYKYQVCGHCNGDAAADQFINCYKTAIEITGNDMDLRPVMVQAQTIDEDQLDEMEKIKMIPSFFIDHIWYCGDYYYESVLGPERSNRINPSNSALKRKMNFTFHQDTPVIMPIMPLTLYSAVNRKTQNGRVLGEEQRISIKDAIRAVTINAAYQYFEEDIKGSIEPGKLADLVILDRNPLEIPAEDLKNIVVLQTIKEGKTIFKRQTRYFKE